MSTFFPTSHSFGTTSPPKPRDHDLTTVYLNAQPIASSTGGGGGGGGCGFGGGDGGVHRAHVLHLHFMHDFWVEQEGSHASYLKSLSSPESQALAPSGSGRGICARASRVAWVCECSARVEAGRGGVSAPCTAQCRPRRTRRSP